MYDSILTNGLSFQHEVDTISEHDTARLTFVGKLSSQTTALHPSVCMESAV